MRRCERVYLESYTSVLMVPKERLVRHPRRSTPSRWCQVEIELIGLAFGRDRKRSMGAG